MEQTTRSTDSILKRYAFTLVVNFFRLGVGLVQSTLVPRALGPKAYGDFFFILNSATRLRGFLNLSAADAFFTYNSKNVRSGTALYVFALWTIIQLFLLLSFVAGSYMFGFGNLLFPDQAFWIVSILVVLEWLLFASALLIQFGDAKAETVKVQRANLIALFVQLILLIGLFLGSSLTLLTFTGVRFIYALVAIFIIVVFLRSRYREYIGSFEKKRVKPVLKYFISFCAPLVVLQVFGTFVEWFDRWFLQFVAGSVEQGFFSIAHQWSTVLLIFATSVLTILWREIAFAFSRADTERVQQLFSRAFKGLFFLTFFCCVPIIFNARIILVLVAGEAYESAATVLVFMMFYASYLMLSQLTTYCFYALEAVKLFGKVALVGLTIKLLLTYVLLAPHDFLVPGLGLGSLGLGIQNAVSGFAIVNINLYVLARLIGVRFWPFLGVQITILLILSFFGFLATLLAMQVTELFFLQLLIMGGLFLAMASLTVFFRPELVGITREELRYYAAVVARKVNRFYP